MKIAVYNKATGIIRALYEVTPDHAALQCLEGEAYSEGDADPVRHRFDADGRRYDYVPVKPDPDAIFDEVSHRWISKTEQVAAHNATVIAQINGLELKQLRATRELAIDPNNDTAKQRLQQIDQQIQAQRALLI